MSWRIRLLATIVTLFGTAVIGKYLRTTVLVFLSVNLCCDTIFTFSTLHNAVQGKVGDPVNAFLPGKVIYAGEIFWGYGKHIIIDHGNNITTVYGHLDKIFVVKGQEITTTKQVIGREGQTGWATGPHLHFEIRVFGIPVNPRTFLGQGNPP